MLSLLLAFVYSGAFMIDFEENTLNSADLKDTIQGLWMIYSPDDFKFKVGDNWYDYGYKYLLTTAIFRKDSIEQLKNSGNLLFFIPFTGSNSIDALTYSWHYYIVRYLRMYRKSGELHRHLPEWKYYKDETVCITNDDCPDELFIKNMNYDKIEADTNNDLYGGASLCSSSACKLNLIFVNDYSKLGHIKRIVHVLNDVSNLYALEFAYNYIIHTMLLGGYESLEMSGIYNLAVANKQYDYRFKYGKLYNNIKNVATKFGLNYQVADNDDSRFHDFNNNESIVRDNLVNTGIVSLISEYNVTYEKVYELLTTKAFPNVTDPNSYMNTIVKDDYKSPFIAFLVMTLIFIATTIIFGVLYCCKLRKSKDSDADKTVDDIKDNA